MLGIRTRLMPQLDSAPQPPAPRHPGTTRRPSDAALHRGIRAYNPASPCPSAQVPRSARTGSSPNSATAAWGGVVYTAHDPRLKRQVAIKLLTADLTRDETAKQRFLQEAQAASALDHPNICTIHEIRQEAE